MDAPPIVSPAEWIAAREKLLEKEKAHMRAGDALAAERRRMPWMAVEKDYRFEGPDGPASLLDLFEGRTHRLSLEPQVMSEAADWMDRQRALWGRLFDVVDEYLKEEQSR